MEDVALSLEASLTGTTTTHQGTQGKDNFSSFIIHKKALQKWNPGACCYEPSNLQIIKASDRYSSSEMATFRI